MCSGGRQMNRRSKVIITAAVTAYLVMAILPFPQPKADTITEVTTSELQTMLAFSKELMLVNTLSPLEFNDAAIPGSVNLPYEHLREGRAALPEDLSTPILFYCQGIKCTKAPNTATLAASMGYTNIYLYREGISAWMRAGNPVEARAKISYQDIRTVKPSILDRLLDKNDPPLVLDVRDGELFESLHIGKGELLNIRMVDLVERLVEIPTDRKVVVVCHKGIQSIKACSWLASNGVKVMGMLEGGLLAWEESGLPVVRAKLDKEDIPG